MRKLFSVDQEFHSPELRGFPFIEGLGSARFRKANRGLVPHRHSGIELHAIWEGRYSWSVEGRMHEVRSGNAFITRPWEMHGSPSHVQDRGGYSWLILSPESFQREGELRLGKWSPLSKDEEKKIGGVIQKSGVHLLPQGDWVDEIIQKIHIELSERPLGFQTRVYSLLAEVLVSVARILPGLKSETPIRKSEMRMADLLAKTVLRDLDRAWSVEALAEVCGLSTVRLKKNLHNEIGLPPHAFVLDLRMDAAIEKMRQGRAFVDIAMDCGFSSQQHFSEMFKRKTSYTPKDFRKRFLAKDSPREK
ncbi:MAG: helix-turn-helix domain-containing protein [Spirochaetia bacterium]|nr:helix-turn-helix domain-containing protein [Spirochaetia bacterium]